MNTLIHTFIAWYCFAVDALFHVVGVNFVSPAFRSRVFKSCYELIDHLGNHPSGVQTLRIARCAAGYELPKTLREYKLMVRLRKSNNIRKTIYDIMIELGDINTAQRNMMLGTHQKRHLFKEWFAGLVSLRDCNAAFT